MSSQAGVNTGRSEGASAGPDLNSQRCIEQSPSYEDLIVGGKRPWMLPEQALRLLTEHSWIFYALWIIAFLTAFAGFAEMRGEMVDGKFVAYNDYGLSYKAAQALLMNAELGPRPGNWYLAIVGIFVPLLTFVSAAAVLLSVFEERAKLFLIKYRYSGHIVICGLGTKGWLFVKDFRKYGYRVVIIEKDDANTMIDEANKELCMVIIGNADETEVLARANIQKAAQLICVCGEDGVNAEIAALAHDLVTSPRKHALSCLAHIFSPRLGALLRGNLIAKGFEHFRVDFFNVFHNAAKKMLEETDPFKMVKQDLPARPHILIVGMGWLGECVLLEAARQYYSSYYVHSQEKFDVTVIDLKAAQLTGQLCSAYPTLEKVCRLNTLDMDAESRQFRDAGFLAGIGHSGPVTQVYVCLLQASLGPDAGLFLEMKAPKHKPVPVMIATKHEWGFPKLGQENVRFFGIFDKTCKIDALNEAVFEKLARRIHEHYVEEEKKKGVTAESNENIRPWEKLPRDIKESNRYQANDISAKLHETNCRVVPRTDWQAPWFDFVEYGIDAEALAKKEHDRWYAEKKKLKTRYGAKKDPNAKPPTHPYFLEWHELLPCIQHKNILAVCKIPGLLESVDLDILCLGTPEMDRQEQQAVEPQTSSVTMKGDRHDS